jgi:hypothetical protein
MLVGVTSTPSGSLDDAARDGFRGGCRCLPAACHRESRCAANPAEFTQRPTC